MSLAEGSREKTSQSELSAVDNNWLSQLSHKRNSDVIHMNTKNVQDLIQTHRANKRFDPTTTLYSAMPSVKDVSVSEMGVTAKTGPFRGSSLQNKRNSGMHSTFFVPTNREDFGPKEKPQL